MPPTQRIPLHAIVQELSQKLRTELPAEIRLRRRIEMPGLEVTGSAAAFRDQCSTLIEAVAGELLPGGGTLELSLIAVDVDAESFARRRGLRRGAHARLSVRGTPADPENDSESRIGARADQVDDPVLSRIADEFAVIDSRLSVDSVSGRFFAVHAYFPVITAMAAPADDLTRGCGTVLFVDDDAALVDIHRRAIEALGYEVIECTEATRALGLVERFPDAFDIVLSDVSMPGIQGGELARRMSLARPDLPIGLSTGFAATSSGASTTMSGFEIVLAKPFGPEELADALHRLRMGSSGGLKDESAG